MIVDTLANASRYRGIAPLLDRGLGEMGRLAESPLADGRHELAGQKLSASFSSYQTEDPEEKPFEAHRRFIDIQVVLQGRETLYWAPLSSLEPRGEYSEANDIAFFTGPAGVAVPLEPGWFTVQFPQDAHKPGCLRGSPSRVRKLVIKVAV
ncbi:MAG: YhcH/YjgK/YiaL family protein [Spirochaetes bacterium]|nr:YhcH/YjgK/YiaL family protein [Spirochaetota bacterium]